MYNIIDHKELTPALRLLEIEAPAVGKKAQPGQFVMVMADECGERIPLTIADWNRERGSISLVINQVGTTTHKLGAMRKGDSIAHLAGPLGKPAQIAKYGNIACVAIGYGIATIVPIIYALRQAGNRVHSIISAPTKANLFGVKRLGQVSDTLHVSTSDGSYGHTGWVTQPLRQMLEGDKPIHRVYVIGSVCMMKLVSNLTKEFNVKTVVTLNPVMVDGTGMCGACRVSIGGVTKFACVDGPEFDGHEVDWDLLTTRRCTYPAGYRETATVYRCQFCGQW